jgi:hypothetical protein
LEIGRRIKLRAVFTRNFRLRYNGCEERNIRGVGRNSSITLAD